jgi:hypothetical protein
MVALSQPGLSNKNIHKRMQIIEAQANNFSIPEKKCSYIRQYLHCMQGYSFSKNLSIMLESSTVSPKARINKIVLILTIATSLFWALGKSINVYNPAVLGTIFEILWFPGLLRLFILPILSILLWIKEKFDFKSLNFYSIIIAIVTISVTVFLR